MKVSNMKITQRFTMLLAAGAFAAMSAFALAQDNGAAGTSPAGGAGKAMLNSVDKMFIMKAEQSNIAEIKTSQLALKKATKQGLKDFGQHMIDDHTKAEDDLKQVASSKGVSLPTDTDAKNKAAYAKLQKLSGAAFDASYAKVQKDGHDATIAVFQKEISGGQDADVKAFAQKYLPAIQDHDKMITDMKMSGMKGKMHKSMKM